MINWLIKWINLKKEKAIKLNKKDPVAYCCKANSLSKLNDNKKALKYYNKALELDPNDSIAYNNKVGSFFFE